MLSAMRGVRRKAISYDRTEDRGDFTIVYRQ
jgi:hypothetical protein